MPTKSILINFNDCPSSIDSLMPDNGLANLAGSLMRKGHTTWVYDYSTLQTILEYRPQEIRQRLKRAFLRYKIETILFKKMSEKLYAEFRAIEDLIQVFRDKKIASVVSELREKIVKENIDFIGFKLWSGEGFVGSVKIAQGLKAVFPQLKIFAGGPHIEVFGERVFRYTDAFNVFCEGEGEEVIWLLAEYAEGKRQLKDIPNILYKEGELVAATNRQFISDLGSFAEPVYDPSVYPAMRGDGKIKIIMLEESRGCPYQCSFCIHRIKSGNAWRIMPVDQIIHTIQNISRQTGTHTFRFSGSNTPCFLRKQIAQRLLETNTKIEYVGFADTRQPEEEDYALLRKAGCVSLFFGVESADPYILEHMMNKKSDPERIRKNLISAREAGILTAASIIVPCPQASRESIDQTVRLIIETKPAGVSVCPAVCYPKTKWFLEAEKYGFKLDENVEEKMMTYTIKFTMPPAMLSPFPFTLDGKDFHAMMNEVIMVSNELERKGVTVNLNDSLLFVAHVLRLSPSQVKHLNQRAMILGEQKTLSRAIREFNRCSALL